MMSSRAPRPLTYDDLCQAREDGNRYELIEGELLLVAGPSPAHQRFGRRLVIAFDRFLDGARLGEVFDSPLDVRFADGSVVQPDVIVVLADRADILREKLIEGAPSLLVEVSSPSSRALDRTRKARLYAGQAVPEYWWVDPEHRSVWIHSAPSGGVYHTIRQETDIARAETIPGLMVSLAELFAPALFGPIGDDHAE